MAKLTVEEVYRGEKYNVMDNAFKELMSLYENIDTLVDLQATTELLVCKHTLIAAKKRLMKATQFRIFWNCSCLLCVRRDTK